MPPTIPASASSRTAWAIQKRGRSPLLFCSSASGRDTDECRGNENGGDQAGRGDESCHYPVHVGTDGRLSASRCYRQH